MLDCIPATNPGADPSRLEPEAGLEPESVVEEVRASASVRVSILASLAALGLSVVFFWLYRPDSALLRGFAALFLCAIVQQDLARNKIPNAITFPSLALALALAAWIPERSLLDSLLGCGLAFVVLFLPFALRVVSAGDVKAMMVLGAIYGIPATGWLLLWTTFLSGAVALVLLIARRGGSELLTRWKVSLGATLATRKITYLRPPQGSAAGTWHPKALGIAFGVIAMQLWTRMGTVV